VDSEFNAVEGTYVLHSLEGVERETDATEELDSHVKNEDSVIENLLVLVSV
jgi:hypothetical protein